MNEETQAIVNWKSIIDMVWKIECVSLCIVAIVAKQGVYNRVNIKKLKAVKGVNNEERERYMDCALVFNNTAKVLITASLAVNPDISDVTIRQS